MKVGFSDASKGKIGLLGHAGVGHSHSHKGLVQDDSGGLAVLLKLFKLASDISLNIKKIEVKTGINAMIKVATESGGIGVSSPRRGITPQEANLMKKLEGREAIRTQALVMDVFGRCYGQGGMEVPVSLQAALCNAALDSFVKNCPNKFYVETENLEGNEGLILGTVLDINKVPVSCLATVNATAGGIGPNEDMEGNSPVGNKGKLMEKLGLGMLPSIVVEGKTYTPTISKELEESTFLIRADDRDDNPVVGESIKKACQELEYPCIYDKNSMKRVDGQMKENKKNLAKRIIELGEKMKEDVYSQDKIETISKIIEISTQDVGAITFMSDKLNDVVGGIGLLPGTSAVYSLVVSEEYYNENIIPSLTDQDVDIFTDLATNSVKKLYNDLEKAKLHLSDNIINDISKLNEYIKLN
ncbi:hypothetical protein [Natranaerofaba carboxydovora]|uniref:hypothetical protein n=1 Tax=Natranaerofaba carboxydovora TaxID=2742683 RepID=UPI001F13D9E6|nr:hypothetical protein [Natranaerofaba carboxydovora]UMZ72952.1 hypothetical protein ACONDI_00491 [Natranaerofaba carboxydovora]